MSWCWGKDTSAICWRITLPITMGAHTPCTRQGCAAPSPCADSRAYRISHLARRSSSALRSDGIIGRHRNCLDGAADDMLGAVDRSRVEQIDPEVKRLTNECYG